MKKSLAISAVGFLFVAFGCSSTPATNDGGSDAAINDAKPDTKKPTEGGAEASTCGSGLTCEVCDGTFSPTQMVTPFASAGVCSGADITAFVAACGAAGDDTKCGDWQNAEQTSSAACYACVYTDQTDPKWGVLVCDANSNCAFNTPGCLDVALNTVSQEKHGGGAGSCGDLYSDAYTCESYSCESCVSDSDYSSCVTSADTNECKAYADPAYATTGACAAANDPDASAAINACFIQTDPDLNTMVTMLCGGGA